MEDTILIKNTGCGTSTWELEKVMWEDHAFYANL
jgi:hypothetical protein